MARRTDGTARRYEFQIFDDEQGRSIAHYLDDVQANGESVAAFIRDALLFYIEQGAQPPHSSPEPYPLHQEIEALWAAVSRTSVTAERIAPGDPSDLEESSGLDMSSRRRSRLKPSRAQPPPTLPEQAVFDSSLAAQQLVQSIRAYNQTDTYRG